jgi:hypothetical protein
MMSARGASPRHRIRPRRLFLQPRRRPHLAGYWGSKYGIVGIGEGIISTETPPISCFIDRFRGGIPVRC